MAYCNKKLCCLVFLALLGLSKLQPIQSTEPKVPCYFIFGDSLVDSGNNNDLPTSAKANYPPYGIDFPGGQSTGRFTNGRTIADFFAKYLGFPHSIRSFALSSEGEDILKGVNYASGSAGILDETGTKLGSNICLNKQIENHKKIISRIVSTLKDENSATKHLNKCLYTVGMGSNDYINNYFHPDYSTKSTHTTEQYATALIEQYSEQLTTLYDLGARKVALSGLGAIGCIPHSITSFETNGKSCVEEINNAVLIFNGKLKHLIDELNAKFKDAKFILLDNFLVKPTYLASVLLDSASIISGCCEVEKETGQCVRDKAPCKDRNASMFFDNFHPTEAINSMTATTQIVSIAQLLNTAV